MRHSTRAVPELYERKGLEQFRLEVIGAEPGAGSRRLRHRPAEVGSVTPAIAAAKKSTANRLVIQNKPSTNVSVDRQKNPMATGSKTRSSSSSKSSGSAKKPSAVKQHAAAAPKKTSKKTISKKATRGPSKSATKPSKASLVKAIKAREGKSSQTAEKGGVFNNEVNFASAAASPAHFATATTTRAASASSSRPSANSPTSTSKYNDARRSGRNAAPEQRSTGFFGWLRRLWG
ncbi:hypothetical protein TGRUB_289970 [Toxoplasma gondii RUB]|uniref:Uncharacterized protein n=3 Tax=Toxoplasma gondii TaxID=5811 RepID=S7UPY4_TOXGG|nr:hypothetical protein TGGT1_289970 [Toxoplasma gondii GT1]KAF4644479.1 hypothetical protein TGRH88_014730 [Toxoplasma gondii]KFG62740.1 hypothetical protein TGRUB_289970 [Toxoplasma gondii RUB]